MITSLQNPLVKHLTKLRLDSAYREEQSALLIEGEKIIKELHLIPKKILFTAQFSAVAESLLGEKIEINGALFQKISGLKQEEGIMAEYPLPPYHVLEKVENVVAFDGVSDPGNLGTLMRTALAFGWKNFYFLPECCDPYNEKVIRAARGAHFKSHLSRGSADSLREWKVKNGAIALAANLDGVHPKKIEREALKLLILGNEGHGVSEVICAFSTSITIPMPGNMESLNVAVAGGILLYLFSTEGEA